MPYGTIEQFLVCLVLSVVDHHCMLYESVLTVAFTLV